MLKQSKELKFKNGLVGLYVVFYNESFKFEVKGGQSENPLERPSQMETCRSPPATSIILVQFLKFQIDQAENDLNAALRKIAIKVEGYNKSEQHGILKKNAPNLMRVIKKHFLSSSSVTWYAPYPARWAKDSLGVFKPLEKMPTLKQLFDPF